MKRIMDTKDMLARELASRTGFYISNMNVVLDALNDIIVDSMKQARIDEDSVLYIAKGVYFYGHRVPEREMRNPQDGSTIISEEKCLPKANFSRAFRNKLFSKPHGYEKKRLNKIYSQNKKIKKQQKESGGEDES